jgi:hypothetical protein
MGARDAEQANIKTTVELPGEIWRAAKIRAVNDQSDLRTVVIAALKAYLHLPRDTSGSVK